MVLGLFSVPNDLAFFRDCRHCPEKFGTDGHLKKGERRNAKQLPQILEPASCMNKFLIPIPLTGMVTHSRTPDLELKVGLTVAVNDVMIIREGGERDQSDRGSKWFVFHIIPSSLHTADATQLYSCVASRRVGVGGVKTIRN